MIGGDYEARPARPARAGHEQRALARAVPPRGRARGGRRGPRTARVRQGEPLRLRARMPRRRAWPRWPSTRAATGARRASSAPAPWTTRWPWRTCSARTCRGWPCADRAWAASSRSTRPRATPRMCAVVAICPAPEDLLRRALRATARSASAATWRPPRPGSRRSTSTTRRPALGPDTALLLLHARGDEQVPPAVSEQLFEAAHEPKRLLLLPGGHHRSLQHDMELQACRAVRARRGAPRAPLSENHSRLGSGRMPSPSDLLELPFLRDALVEVVLLAVAGGMVGAWVVLRRLAFFSHAVGSATFPGLVTADATGHQPHARSALAVALGYAGGVSRTARARARRRGGHRAPAGGRARHRRDPGQRRVRVRAPAWTGCCSAPCSAWTARTCGSRRACAVVAAARHARARPGLGARSGSIPTAPRALGLPVAAPTWRCSRSWRSRRWRRSPPWAPCSWAPCSCCPPPRRALLARSVPRPGRAGRSRSRSRRAWSGLYLAYWLDAPPGPPIAVLGAAAYGALALARRRGRRRGGAPRERSRGSWPDGLAAGYGGPPALTRASPSRAAAGSRSACSGPNGGGKTTLFRALLGELRPARGELQRGRTGRPTWRRPSAPASTSLSAPLDVALMGTLAAGRWWRPPGARRPRGGARGARPRGSGGPRARPLRRALGRPAPARPARPGARAGRARAAARRAARRRGPRQRRR